MKKKFLMLSALFAAGSVVTAQAQTTNLDISLDVIVRDFQPNHPDFENFSEESVKNLDNIYSFGLPGYDISWYGLSAYHNTCGNKESKAGVALGMDGLPLVANPVLPPYLQQVSLTGGNLMYGQCKDGVAGYLNQVQRGFKQSQGTTFTGVLKNTCVGEESKNSGGNAWGNEVYYTPGMVQPYLTFDLDSAGEPLYLKGAHIHKLNEACDNVHFEQWFEDVPGTNKVSEVLLTLPSAADNPKYKELDYNYNNGGYFPLDLVNNQAWAGSRNSCDGDRCEQWGPQSFSIFCPPYAYQYASTQTDFNGNNTSSLCAEWNKFGGARGLSTETAKTIAANSGSLGLQHLRNYNFTMMGYASFKYYKQNNTDELNQEIFEFAGDDDMWIFVDGVLAVDLGGTHLATPGIVNIRTLAANNHGCHEGEPLSTVQQGKNACGADGQWTDGSWHHLHFFYADRQTDGSNLYIRANLAEVKASAFGQPQILEAEVDVSEGILNTYIYTNTQLHANSIAAINASNGTSFPILSKRANSVGTLDTLAFKIENFEYIQKTSKGYSYRITGKLCTDQACTVLKNPVKGDSLAFNFPPNDSVDASSQFNRFYSGNNFQIFSATLRPVDTYHWGPVLKIANNTSTTVIPADTTIDRPPFDNSTLDKGKLSNDQTGEIIITPLPVDYSNSENQSSWIAENIDKYSKAPGDGETTPAGQVVINSKTKKGNGTTGSVDSSRCTSSKGVENCVSFAFVTDQAFSVTVRVFDHLGHFVNQYSQELNAEQFNAITNSNVKTDDECTTKPDTQSGSIVASVKTYPVAQDGRKLGTGVYIYQISLVEYPQKHCVNISGEQTPMDGEYKRTEYKETRGFRRVTVK